MPLRLGLHPNSSDGILKLEATPMLLRQHGVICSMSGRGDCCCDNAVVQSFFKSLKAECVKHRCYRTRGRTPDSTSMTPSGPLPRRGSATVRRRNESVWTSLRSIAPTCSGTTRVGVRELQLCLENVKKLYTCCVKRFGMASRMGVGYTRIWTSSRCQITRRFRNC